MRHELFTSSLILSAMFGLLGCTVEDDDDNDPDIVRVFDGGDLTGEVTWDDSWEVRSSMTVKGTLTLEPCTTVRLNGGTISVQDGGAIKALGTAECPVRIISAKAAPAAGDWDRIDIYGTASNDTVFRHTQIAHAKGGIYGAIWVEGGASLSLDQVKLSNIQDASIMYEKDARVQQFAGVSFDAVDGALIKIAGDLVPSLTPITVTNTTNPRVVLSGDEITRAGAWKNLGVPVELPGLTIKGGAIEVEAGSALKMAPDAVVSVRDSGALRTLGTAASPVTITSAKTSPAAGDWTRFDFYGTSESTNLFRHTTIQHGGDDTYGVFWVEDGATVSLENATFSTNSSCDVTEDGTVNNTASTYEVCGQ